MRYIATLTLLVLLGGCGQTGPLYLPGEEPQPQGRGSASDNSEEPIPDGI
jgi:predicted small lipoprotein YifL